MYNIEFTCRPDRSHARTVLRALPTVPGASQADKCNDLLDISIVPEMQYFFSVQLSLICDGPLEIPFYRFLVASSVTLSHCTNIGC